MTFIINWQKNYHENNRRNNKAHQQTIIESTW